MFPCPGFNNLVFLYDIWGWGIFSASFVSFFFHYKEIIFLFCKERLRNTTATILIYFFRLFLYASFTADTILHNLIPWFFSHYIMMTLLQCCNLHNYYFNGMWLLHGYGVSLWGEERFLEIVVLIAQHCKCAKFQWIVLFTVVKTVHFVICILPQHLKEKSLSLTENQPFQAQAHSGLCLSVSLNPSRSPLREARLSFLSCRQGNWGWERA